MRKIVETRSSLSNAIKDTSTIMRSVTPPYIIQTKGLRMIVLVSLIALLRELLVFRMVHPYIAIHSVECFLHLLVIHVDTCMYIPICVHVHVHN